MKKIILLSIFVLYAMIANATWVIIFNTGSNCAGSAMSLRVCDSLDHNINYSSSGNGRYIEWHNNGSCTGSIAYNPGPGFNAWFFNAPSTPNTYTYYAHLSTGECLSYTLNVITTPSAAGAITGSTTVCKGQNSVIYHVPSISYAYNYVWTLPSGATGSSNADSIIVNYGGSAVSGDITVYGHNSCGNGTTSTLSITVAQNPNANAGNDTAVCSGSSITLSATGGNSYSWNNGVVQGVPFTPSSTTTYNVTVTNSNGCSATDNITVTVNASPSAAGTISGSTTVCQNQNSVSYNVPSILNATSYIWTLPTGASGSSSTNSINVNYGGSAVSGNITVKGHNNCGDGSVSNLYITVVPKPNANAGNDTIICPGASITLTATGGNSYTWNNGVTQGVSFTPSATKTYTVTVSNGFCTATDSVKVTIATPPPTPVIYQVSNDLFSTASVNNQWYDDSGIITGATLQSFTPTSTSHYYCIVSDTLGCLSDTSNVIYVVITGISNISSNNLFVNIYPTPANDKIIIDVPSYSVKNKTVLELHSIDGKLLNIISIQKSKTEINISELPAGVYLIKVNDTTGVTVKKIIKE